MTTLAPLLVIAVLASRYFVLSLGVVQNLDETTATMPDKKGRVFPAVEEDGTVDPVVVPREAPDKVSAYVASRSDADIFAIFDELDVDKSGDLSPFELATAVAKLVQRAPSAKQVSDLLDAVSNSRSQELNTLTAVEFLRVVRAYQWKSDDFESGALESICGGAVFERDFHKKSLGFGVKEVSGVLIVSKVVDEDVAAMVEANDILRSINGVPLVSGVHLSQIGRKLAKVQRPLRITFEKFSGSYLRTKKAEQEKVLTTTSDAETVDSEMADKNESDESAGQKSMRVMFALSIFVLYVMVPAASQIVFKTFACETLDDEKKEGATVTMLRNDYSIDCAGAAHIAAQAFASLMILVWPIGVPLFFSVLLFQHKKAVTVPRTVEEQFELADEDDSGSVDAKEFVAFMKKLEDDVKNDRLHERQENSRLDSFRFLFETYSLDAWYWEIVVTIRRLFITGVLVIFEQGSVMQLSIALFLCFGSALLQTTFNPYQDEAENHFALAVETNTFVVVFITILGMMDPRYFEGEDGKHIGIFLVILTIIAFILGGGIMLWELHGSAPLDAALELETDAVKDVIDGVRGGESADSVEAVIAGSAEAKYYASSNQAVEPSVVRGGARWASGRAAPGMNSYSAGGEVSADLEIATLESEVSTRVIAVPEVHPQTRKAVSAPADEVLSNIELMAHLGLEVKNFPPTKENLDDGTLAL
jgi:hypothetical protein